MGRASTAQRSAAQTCVCGLLNGGWKLSWCLWRSLPMHQVRLGVGRLLLAWLSHSFMQQGPLSLSQLACMCSCASPDARAYVDPVACETTPL